MQVKWFIENFKEEYFYNNLPYENFIFDCFSDSKKKIFLSKFFRLPAVGKSSRVYWIQRGYTDVEANFYRQEYKKDMKGKTPFTADYWLNRGYSKEEAEYQKNKIRPVCKEYWIEKGYSIEDAENMAKNTLLKNSITASKNAVKQTGKEYKSIRRKEYWILHGYSEEEAKNKVAQVQATFSLKKCITKYGHDDGIKIWEERQRKWQLTLSEKSSTELDLINSKKSIVSLHLFENKELSDIFDMLNKVTPICKTIDEYFSSLQQTNNYLLYVDFDYFITKVKVSQLNWFKISVQYDDFIIKAKNISNDETRIQHTNYGNYIKHVEEGLLRSSFEIFFYDKIKPHSQSLKIGRQYPNSSYMYDFLIDDKFYIEIAPNYFSDVEYRNKMDKKKKLFNCIILKSIREIEEYAKDYINAKSYNIRTIDSFC